MTEPLSIEAYRQNQRRVWTWAYRTSQYPPEDEISPSDSISNIGSYQHGLYDGPPIAYPPWTYEGLQQQQQHPQSLQHPLNFYSPAVAPYSASYQQPPRSPAYSYISSNNYFEENDLHSSGPSSSPIPSGLAAAYVPTVSMYATSSTLVSPDPPSRVPYHGSRTNSYADSAHYQAIRQTEFLQVPQPVYPNPFSPYETYSATTSPNTSPYLADTRPLSSHSHHRLNRPHSSHSHGSAHSPRSSHSHAPSYQSPQASPTPVSEPSTLQSPAVVVVSGYVQCVVVQPTSGRRLSVIVGQ